MAALPSIGGLDAAVGHKRSRPDDWDARLLEVVDDHGGITDSADGGRVVALFTEAREEAQQELACEALQRTPAGSPTLLRLVKVGILTPLRDWLKAASSAMNKSSILAVLKALRHLPVDIAALKASKVGQYVAKLSERSGSGSGGAAAVAGIDRGVVALANDIYDMWAAAASGKSAAAAAAAAAGSSSSSSASASSSAKDKEKEKDSGAKRQRRDAATDASKLTSLSSALPLPPPVSLTQLSGSGKPGSSASSSASSAGFPSLTSLSSVSASMDEDRHARHGGSSSSSAAAVGGAGASGASDGPLPSSLIDASGDSAAALAAALEASAAASNGGDEDDWGYGVPPPPHEDGEPGMSPEEMGGLMKVRGEGLPDRFGRVPGGLLKNRVLGIAGGRPLGARERKSIVTEVAGAGAAAVLAAASAASAAAGGKRSVAWIDALPAATARAAHERIPRASADAFQASHLVAVKFFKRDAEPLRVSTPLGAAGSGAGGSGVGAGARPGERDRDSMDRGSSERHMGPAGALAAAAGGAGLSGGGEGGDGEGRHASFREQLKAEKAREHEAVRAALRASGSSAFSTGRLLVGGVNVQQGGQLGLHLFHAAPQRMVPLLAPTPLRGRGAAAFSPEAAAAAGVPPAGAWACASSLRAVQPVAMSAGVAEKVAKRVEAAARAAGSSILAAAVQWRTQSVPPVHYGGRAAIPAMPPVEPDPSLEAAVAAAGPAGLAPPHMLKGLPAAPRPHMLPPRAPAARAGTAAAAGGAGAVPVAAPGAGAGMPASVAGVAAGLTASAAAAAAAAPSRMASLLSSLKSMAGPAAAPVPAAPPAYGAPAGLQPLPSHVPVPMPQPSMPAHLQHHQAHAYQPQPQPQMHYAPPPGAAPAPTAAGVAPYGAIPVHAHAHSAPPAPAPAPSYPTHYYQPAPAAAAAPGLPPGAVLVAAPPPGAVPVSMHQPQTHAPYGYAPAPAPAYGGAGAPPSSGSLLPPPGHALVPLPASGPYGSSGGAGGGLLPTTGAPYGAAPSGSLLGSSSALGAPPGAGSAGASAAGRRFPTSNKPCLFFNTRVGCRKGASCAFVHDPKYIPTLEELQGIASSERGMERARETQRAMGQGGGYGGGRPGL